MTPHEENASPLLPQRAFVVHFRAATNIEAGMVTGRVEHVLSGRTAHFESLAHLLAFVHEILTAEAASER